MRSLLAAAFLALQVAASPAPPAARPPPPAPAVAPRAARPPVILVSIDGFRPDYLHRGATPVLDRLAREGVLAKGMHPAFPSLTFPNHYTLVTGLTPDHHGVVANSMDDPTIQPDSHFDYHKPDVVADGRWWAQGEPVWVTAKVAGLRAATLFWPGSEAEIGGQRPDRFAHFDDAITPAHRVDMVLDWLSLPPEKRPDFITLYFDGVDHAGHDFGPAARETRAAVGEVDRALGRLVAGLKGRRLWAGANLVIVSDHGMIATPHSQVVFLDDWIAPAQVKTIMSGPVAFLSPLTPAAEAAVLAPHAHVGCWRKGELPAHLRYGAHPRIPPVVCVAEGGWQLWTREGDAKRKHYSLGEHGYDPAATPAMDALFLAHGPDFRRGYRQPAFANLDVQPLLLHLLHLPPTRVDGSLESLRKALSSH